MKTFVSKLVYYIAKKTTWLKSLICQIPNESSLGWNKVLRVRVCEVESGTKLETYYLDYFNSTSGLLQPELLNVNFTCWTRRDDAAG
jgi:hypothetical protein